MAPLPQGDADLGSVLLEAMDEADYTRRGLAAELQRRRPRKDIESWRGTVREYLKNEAVPGEKIARLLAEILDKPADYFLRRPQREVRQDELVRLREENERLKLLLEESGAAGGSSGGQS